MCSFILHQLVSQATLPKSPIACNGLISAIAHAWGLEPQLRQLAPLFQGGRRSLAACIQMEMIIMTGVSPMLAIMVFPSFHSFTLLLPQSPTSPIGLLMMISMGCRMIRWPQPMVGKFVGKLVGGW